MATRRVVFRLLGAAVGAVIVIVAVLAVFFVKWETDAPPAPPPVRPLKTLTVGGAVAPSGRKYPGKVRAVQEVDLAFQVAGPLIELGVKKGQEVEKDDLLARIDPRDFQNNLIVTQAVLKKNKLDVGRFTVAFERGAATQKEVDDAKADLEIAQAQVAIAAKALDDTYLRAPFPGRIANKFVENFQNVKAKQPILSLQDITSVEVEVSVPEERVARQKQTEGTSRFVATFEYLPGREFDVEIKEFATEADPATQTYAVTFVMPSPSDVTILPGMTATIHEYRKAPADAPDAAHLLPIDAVPVDGVGNYYVWVLKQSEGDTYTVHRVDVKVGEMVQDKILVLGGVNKGDRVAAAGVHFLRENQRVRPLSSNGKGD